MKPLFVPLMTRYFREFESGQKRVEYRRYGLRWNERTCVPGRPVVLSHGYSGARINARVASFSVLQARDAPDGQATYGPDALLAAIQLEPVELRGDADCLPKDNEKSLPLGHRLTLRPGAD
jgi:hypothetical protein